MILIDTFFSIEYFFQLKKKKQLVLCILVAMKKWLLPVLMVLNLAFLQAQEVKFISVNHAVDSLENISFKRLPKLLAKETLRPDTLTTPAKWMIKLNKKLAREQRRDSNIYRGLL